MAKRKKAKKAATPVPKPRAAIALRIQVEPSPSTPDHYVNYAEIGHSQHDFVLTAARIPAKFPAAIQAEFIKSGALSVDAEVQLTFPPTLIRPLIQALELQLKSFEQTVSQLPVTGEPNGKRK